MMWIRLWHVASSLNIWAWFMSGFHWGETTTPVIPHYVQLFSFFCCKIVNFDCKLAVSHQHLVPQFLAFFVLLTKINKKSFFSFKWRYMLYIFISSPCRPGFEFSACTPTAAPPDARPYEQLAAAWGTCSENRTCCCRGFLGGAAEAQEESFVVSQDSAPL